MDVPGAMLVHNPYVNSVLRGAFDAGDEHGYNVTLFTHPWVDRAASLERLLETPVDGLLLLAPPIDTDIVGALAEADLPIVATSARAMDLHVPCVDTDNVQGATLAVEHLISLGHTRIAHMSGTMTQIDAIERAEAFRAVMSEHGLEVPAEYIVETGFQAANAYADATALLQLPDPPTAIFAATDYIAYWTIHAARELGIDVPGRLSVVGFDDGPVAVDCDPKLTTVRQPLVEIGSFSASLLMQSISGRNVEAKTHTVSTELVVRASTASTE